jgi:hypothetical protein
MAAVPEELTAYYKSGRPLICEIDAQPWLCRFWPFDELIEYNDEYQVHEFAPGYFGFATSGGGEMYAFSPNGAIVCLAFSGMSPKEELSVAPSWASFERMLKSAL